MMTERLYAFAGVEFSVEISSNDRIYVDEGHLSAFRVESVRDPHRFSFRMVTHFPPPSGQEIVSYPGFRIYKQDNVIIQYLGAVRENWEEAYIRAEHNEKDHVVYLKESQFPRGIGTKTVLKSMLVEHLIAQNNGFVFHCAYIEHHGKAILFTAPSGTGKTTQAELWKQLRGAEIVNGDRTVIRMAEGELLAEGIPFAGSSPYCENRSLPIEAIVYLGQAPKTSIRRMHGIEAFSKIWEGISVNTWEEDDMARVSQVVQRVSECIPIFHMPCTPDESAIIALEQELRKLVNL